MVLQKICPPALIYLVFSITQVGIDTFQGLYNMAFVKLWVALVFTILLNFLCQHGLGVISWIIVFVPFILMTIIVSMLLVMFGLNPSTGKMQSYTPPKRHRFESGSYYDDYTGYTGYTGTDEMNPRMANYDQRQIAAYERQHRRRGEHERYDRRHRRHHHHNGDEELSGPQQHVLDDMVQRRTGLAHDPLQQS